MEGKLTREIAASIRRSSWWRGRDHCNDCRARRGPRQHRRARFRSFLAGIRTAARGRQGRCADRDSSRRTFAVFRRQRRASAPPRAGWTLRRNVLPIGCLEGSQETQPRRSRPTRRIFSSLRDLCVLVVWFRLPRVSGAGRRFVRLRRDVELPRSSRAPAARSAAPFPPCSQGPR